MKTLLVDAVRTIISSDKEYTIDTWWLNKDLADYLITLNNCRIIVVTNAPDLKFAKIQRYLADYDFEIYSLENNPWKTDPEFFKKLLQDKKINASDCFYLDHKQENLEAAVMNGIEWVLYVNNEQMIPILQQKFSS